MARHGRCGVVLSALLTMVAACAAHAPRPEPSVKHGAESPADVTRAFYAALHAGDAAGAARLVAGPNGVRAAEGLVRMARGYEQLETALRDRFGEEAARAVGYRDRVRAEDEAIRAAREHIEGGEATVTSGDRTLASLRRVDGRWHIVLDDALGTDEGIAALVREGNAVEVASGRVVPMIRGGLFDSADDAIEAFRNDVALQMEGAEPELPTAPSGDRPSGATI